MLIAVVMLSTVLLLVGTGILLWIWVGLRRGESYPASAHALVAAADQGGAAEKRILGLAYLRGEQGLPKDMRSARHYVEEAAELGDPEAMFQLAVMLRTGYGGLKDVPKALTWLRDATAAGHPRAALLVEEIQASRLPR